MLQQLDSGPALFANQFDGNGNLFLADDSTSSGGIDGNAQLVVSDSDSDSLLFSPLDS